MQPVLRMVVGASPVNAAMAKAMATRWSPWLMQVPPLMEAPPWRMNPSGVSWMGTLSVVSSAAMVWIRSVSLTRNSSAPVTTVRPWASAAATQKMGNSSIILGTRAASMVTPRSGAVRATRSPTGSPASSLGLTILISAPISPRMSRIPVLAGLRPTLSIRTSESGTKVAPTRKKAAADRSPGTDRSLAA